MSLEFGLEGPYTVMHHQHYQMVDLLMQHCRQTMGGLNPHALPHVPSKNGTKESACKPKNNKQNVEPSKWHTHKKKKGNRKKNINKNNTVQETKIVGNRFSRLQEMVKDCPEVTEVLKKVVEEEKPQNENDIKKYEVESVEIQTLDEEIRKYKERDQKIEHNMNLNENIDDNSNKTDDESEEEQNAWCKEIDYDSEEERNEWRLLHPDEESDSDCSTYYESDEEEDEEEWFNRKIKWRERSNSA